MVIMLGMVLIGLLLVGLFVAFLLMRQHHRKTKNLERGLSMVTLRIFIPPISDDVDNKSRDERDVVEENIAKATSLYSLLVAIADKTGFKTGYYGQQHLGFEIVFEKGFVSFYIASPADQIAIVRQAVTSAYSAAKIQKVEEHNIFAKDIQLTDINAGYLELKKDFAYPIATYVESRQDIMKVLLGSLADLEEAEGACIQLLLRPASDDWIKTAKTVAKKLSKPDDDSGFFKTLTGLLSQAVKPSESAGSKERAEISQLDKSRVEAIEKKTTQPGFETAVRLLVASADKGRARNVYRGMASAFALLDAPKSNGFRVKNVKPGKMQSFISDFNLRLFAPSNNQMILNVDELASIFHLPDESNIPTSQLERQTAKQVDGPRNFTQKGLLLGHNVFRGQRREIRLGIEDRMRHMYVVGQTGTGKSVFLENLAYQDILAGRGCAFVDPHGETAEKLLGMIPPERMDDVVYFSPGNMEYPMGLNIFEYDTVDKQDFLIQEAIAMLYKLYDPQHQGIMGPRYEYMFRNAAKLIMADPAGGTLIDIPKLFNDRQFVNRKLRYVSDQTVLDFWNKEILDSASSREFGDIKNWFLSKFSAFLSNTMMRNIIGQTKSSFDLRKIMDEGKIMIINLSLGQTGELNMKLLGMLFVTKFQMAAMGRADMDRSKRRDFILYIDEFQNFATDSFSNILSAARKYRLGLVVANQHTSQLSEEIRDSVYGNVGTAVSFRINASDAEQLIKQFYNPVFEVDDMTRLPIGHSVVRTLIQGAPTNPFNMETLPPIVDDIDLKLAVEQQLLRRHGRPRAKVEAEITQRLKTSPLPARPPTETRPAGSTPPHGLRPPGYPPAWRPPAGSQPSAFVADWYRKKALLKEQISLQKQQMSEGLERQKKLKATLERQQQRLKVLKQKPSSADKDAPSSKESKLKK